MPRIPGPVDFVKRLGPTLLVAGVALIVGSCVPLVQGLWSIGDAEPLLRMNIPPRGGAAPLEVPDSVTVVPVAVMDISPAAGAVVNARLGYEFAVVDTTGEELVRETGSAALDTSAADPGTATSGPLTVRLPRMTVPAGRWTVRWRSVTGAHLVRGAEIRLLEPTAGPVGLLMTALVLGIGGWLTASLGALQWIRSEAVRPGAPDSAEPAAGERSWVVACHLSALSGYLLPFGHLIGPLTFWLARRRVFPGVDQAGKNALNFQLSATLYVLVGLVLSLFLIGLVILFLVVVFHFSVVLHASLRAQRGLDVVYPFSMKFI